MQTLWRLPCRLLACQTFCPQKVKCNHVEPDMVDAVTTN